MVTEAEEESEEVEETLVEVEVEAGMVTSGARRWGRKWLKGEASSLGVTWLRWWTGRQKRRPVREECDGRTAQA